MFLSQSGETCSRVLYMNADLSHACDIAIYEKEKPDIEVE
jgi:hypothetical protein